MKKTKRAGLTASRSLTPHSVPPDSGTQAKSQLQRSSCLLQPRSVSADRYPTEAIVGLGFRGWIAGYQSGEIGCWQEVWKLYSNLLGTKHAEAAVGSLSEWAKAVAVASHHQISVRPLSACGFCRDECLAISMIAACQHNTCPAMRACAFALIENSMVDEVLHHAGTYALTLRSVEHVISPSWIINANAFVVPVASRPM
ncbi:MAG: hypothetical protein KDJ47_03785 [Hyphomicrobiaceae bacterium]|nr:hypothetical protein [Hyphomicrobiaceae bacterium]